MAAPTTNTFNAGKQPWGTEPPSKAYLVTPDNTNYLYDDAHTNDKPICSRGISFGTAGTLKVEFPDGTQVTIPSGALAAGVIHPMKIVKVFATGTGASDIVVWT